MKNTIKAELTLKQAIEMYKYYEWQARSQAETEEDIKMYIELSENMERAIKDELIKVIDKADFRLFDEIVDVVEKNASIFENTAADDEPIDFGDDEAASFIVEEDEENAEEEREYTFADVIDEAGCSHGFCIVEYEAKHGDQVKILDNKGNYLEAEFYIGGTPFLATMKEYGKYSNTQPQKAHIVREHIVVDVVQPQHGTYKCLWNGEGAPKLGQIVESYLDTIEGIVKHDDAIIYGIDTIKATSLEIHELRRTKRIQGVAEDKMPLF